ncbi:MAG: ERCC4 domain-containing protein, partial [Thermoprotei archaeon]
MHDTIVADYREKDCRLVSELNSIGCKVVYSRLDVADYLVSPEIAVERKTSFDLANSLIDGRLLDQMERMSKTYSTPVLLLVGSLEEASSRAPNPGLLYSQISKVMLTGARLISVASDVEAAQLIKWLHRE